jgi:hypothetical protein
MPSANEKTQAKIVGRPGKKVVAAIQNGQDFLQSDEYNIFANFVTPRQKKYL